ncbi:MAG: tRNA lysidine(34) synthetase TilS [Tepidisphaeraceae bacterium]
MDANFDDLSPHSTWLVGVSGGADSVALLRLLYEHRPDVRPIIVHLNHQTRGEASNGDERFVVERSKQLGIRCVTSTRNEVELSLRTDTSHRAPVQRENSGDGSDALTTDDQHDALPTNLSARFRALRHHFFARVARELNASGVLLAHHADDQAETVLLRLLRGGEPTALAGIRPTAHVNGLLVRRPLLTTRRADIEAYLCSINQPWREDASNQSPKYARNRVRMFLRDRPALVDQLLQLAAIATAFDEWMHANTPTLESTPLANTLADLPALIVRRALRHWLTPSDVSPTQLEQLIEMARDRTSRGAVDIDNSIRVRRVRSRLRIESKERHERDAHATNQEPRP